MLLLMILGAIGSVFGAVVIVSGIFVANDASKRTVASVHLAPRPEARVIAPEPQYVHVTRAQPQATEWSVPVTTTARRVLLPGKDGVLR